MKKLENLKSLTKGIALVWLVIAEKKLLDISLPKNPVILRKLILIGGTLALVGLTEKVLLGAIDRHFNGIMKEIEGDMIGMIG